MYNNVRYEVIVGNIGMVYCGPSRAEALADLRAYTQRSVSGIGRAAGESVHMLTVCAETGLVCGSVEHTPLEVC